MQADEFQRIKKIVEGLPPTGTFDITGLEVDLTKCRVAWTVEVEPNNALSAGKQKKTIVCKQVVNFHCAPDFTDDYPVWTIHESSVEQLMAQSDFKPEEWFGFDKNKCDDNFWKQQMPFYRLNFDCWGLRASILCRQLRIDEVPEVKTN